MPQQNDTLPDFLGDSERATVQEVFRQEVGLLSCMYWRNAPPWDLGWRRCDDVFLLFPVRGAFRVRLRGRRPLVVGRGEYLILPEGMEHGLEIAAGEKALWQVAVHYQVHDRWRRSVVDRLSSFVGRVMDAAETERELSELVCLMGRDPATAQGYGAAFLRRLLVAHFREHPPTGEAGAQGDARVRQVLARMEAEYGSAGLSVEELAQSAGLTAVQFRKIFRRDVGEGPKQFLQGLRLRRAAALLRHSTGSVKEVAARCGFGSDHYFHLAFRREFGVTPTSYRLGGGF